MIVTKFAVSSVKAAFHSHITFKRVLRPSHGGINTVRIGKIVDDFLSESTFSVRRPFGPGSRNYFLMMVIGVRNSSKESLY